MRHCPVLLKEAIFNFALHEGDCVVDATLGDGGHAEEILKKIGEKGILIGIDQDSESLESAKSYLKKYKNFIPKHGNFRDIKMLAENFKPRAILFDLGWSTPQFDERGRGFSFQKDEPLDMRMDKRQALTASEIVNSYSESEIGRILRMYGEEKKWRLIAKKIIEQRKIEKIQTTKQLVEIIGCRRYEKIHPATRVFQALRIAVNDEINALKQGLEQAIDLLQQNGRIVVISFHSLEDRIVKNAFKDVRLNALTKKPICASEAELVENPSSRSAKLRVAEKK